MNPVLSRAIHTFPAATPKKGSSAENTHGAVTCTIRALPSGSRRVRAEQPPGWCPLVVRGHGGSRDRSSDPTEPGFYFNSS